MFTFSICTYNHSNYIVQHLESIKFIINTYSYHEKTSLLVCDDCSSDDTIEKVNFWINKNHSLFKKIKVVKSNTNQGTVLNFKRLIDNIDTPYFKLLAGDDVYNKYDIVKRYSSKNLIIGFSLPFNLNNNDYFDNICNNYFTRQKMFLLNNNFKFYKKYILANNSFSSPAMGYNIEWLKEYNIYGKYENIKYIEDRPLWNFLFTKKKFEVELELIPYVLYRNNVGVTSKNNTLHHEYLKDLETIDKLCYSKKNIFDKLFKKVLFRIIFYIYKYIPLASSKKMWAYKKSITNNFHDYQLHLDMLIDKSKRFESEFKKRT
ncbi:glycosyltransferase [Providencia rettgeri]